MQRLAWGKVCVAELRGPLEAEGMGAGPEAVGKEVWGYGLGSVGVPRIAALEQARESAQGFGPASGAVPWRKGLSPGGSACPTSLPSPCLAAQ